VTVAAFGLVWLGFVFRNDPHVVLHPVTQLLARRGP